MGRFQHFPGAGNSALVRQLHDSVSGEVRFDAGTRALYTMDASNYRRVPEGVVRPRTIGDVVATVAACREHDVPIVVRGAGTSIAGNATGTGVVIDTSRYLTGIAEVDPERRIARVEPGVVLADLQAAAAPYGLRFGPDPSTQTRCTLGGMIGNNSCGSHSVAWGTTADNVEELDVLTYGGTRLRVGRLGDGRLSGGTGGAADGGTGSGTGGVASGAGDRAGDGTGTPAGRAIGHMLGELVDANLALIRQRFFTMPRRVSGYSLDWLLPERGAHLARALTGTEGTCVTVLGATVRLVAMPAARVLLVLGFPDDVTAADAVPALLPSGPLTVEGLDRRLLELARTSVPDLPRGGAWLFAEIGGESAAEAADRAVAIARSLGHDAGAFSVLREPAAQRAAWRVREDGAGLGTRLPDGSEAWPGWEDAAVPPERLGAYLREFRELLTRYGLHGLTYGHFGEGCVHVRIDFDLITRRGVSAFREFVLEAGDLVVAHGGSPSGEHGDGQARAELLERMYGPEVVRLFERFKAAWDPDDKMNPGMVVRPYRVDENVRFAAMAGREPRTVLAYAEDRGSLRQAARRCVGVGRCVTKDGGVMCPSYRATKDEKHSTRGRARLLFEMISGEVVTGGWRSPEVHEALDLCLACKGCARDCPVTVDMAAYKAEFLHHYYEGRLRPAAHYSMGWLPLWLRLLSSMPGGTGALNAAARRAPLAGLAKRVGGIAAERALPSLAREPFTAWWRRRAASSLAPSRRTPSLRTSGRADHRAEHPEHPEHHDRAERPALVLWPDTFTNYLSPEVGRAAVSVLEAAGWRVVLPPKPVCCGLTWFSTGQLGIARSVAGRTLEVLRPALEAGLPVVGLEPSCTAFFRSDLTELLPGDGLATRLAELTRTFAETLTGDLPRPGGLDEVFRTDPYGTAAVSAIAQVHCHQYAVLGFDADMTAAAAAGIGVMVPDTGCCGLAGDFGFARGHYEVSVACAERALLPAIEAAPATTFVLADGFSCRTQIAELSDRRALHLAEALCARLPA
jgi:FAD/FMN-containing dehydrogenase/Fe-S oxidoreductase